jgi:transglutaminase-like putative cysteine protease
MRFTIRHRTTFDYEDLVSLSHHLLHLTPREHAGQRCIWSEVQIVPSPSRNTAGFDYFGNPVRHLMVSEPHRRLVVEANSIVERGMDDGGPAVGAGPAWEDVVALMVSPRGEALAAYEFGFASPLVSCDADVRRYAEASFPPRRPLLDACMDLTRRIYDDFEYRGGVSDVSTPVARVLEMRQGVCQDFAHLQIACLRSLGLSARYVSGYLLTRPPEGQQKLIGADASHAWLAVWADGLGWLDFDPTNNMRPAGEHISLAWGRDYGDVSPINGLIVGGGKHIVTVAVDVNLAPDSVALPSTG